LTGGFRMDVGQKPMTRALSQVTGADPAELAHRLAGKWTPDDTTFAKLVIDPIPDIDLSRPYPLCFARQFDPAIKDLGDFDNWAAERKWDGLRGQLILRGGSQYLWTGDTELLTGHFPEFAMLKDFLPPGTVVDGEILAWANETPMPLEALKKRIGQRSVSAKLLKEAPVILRAFDLLEDSGNDIRPLPFVERRTRLEAHVGSLPPEAPVRLSPLLDVSGWDDLAQARAHSRDVCAKGIMLKRKDSLYRDGRQEGDWWAWDVDPLIVNGVLIYAHPRNERRASPSFELTFAVWDGEIPVPVAKAQPGLTESEHHEITAWVAKNTVERFGPVRSVKPVQVFEIAFDGIAEAPRRKSGVVLRSPRVSRWRKGMPPREANTLNDLKALLDAFG
ncbi:MAG: ATP-dependent DNA ligase, partial [Boseongicola sp.]|nr:ATP-dependent DNA ligase [Boseongicola sp.]